MIIDGHRHIIEHYQPILKEMDAHNISRTILVGVGVKDLDVVTIQNSFVFRFHFLVRTLGRIKAKRILNSQKFKDNLKPAPENKHVLRAIKEQPDRFYGFVFVNPEKDDTPDIIEECLNQGMAGIKLALFQYPTDLNGPKTKRICEIASHYKVPLFIHQGLSRKSSHLSSLVSEFKDVIFIIAHAGVQYFYEVIQLAQKHDNVYIDTSSYFVTSSKLKHLCRTLGAERLIFGTDIPVMARNINEALVKLDQLNLSAKDMENILGKNLLSMLGNRG